MKVRLVTRFRDVSSFQIKIEKPRKNIHTVVVEIVNILCFLNIPVFLNSYIEICLYSFKKMFL